MTRIKRSLFVGTIAFISNHTENGKKVEACFAPDEGMNLLSLKIKGKEVLDLSTKEMFSLRSAGLGALIGPHFHHRSSPYIPIKRDLSFFKHIKKLPETQKELFSHGIARYVPWKYQADGTQIIATLKGSDLFHDCPIKELEGFDFEMHFEARAIHDGLLIDYRIQSQTPSVIGFHYYYKASKNAFLTSLVKPSYRSNKGINQIPQEIYKMDQKKLYLKIENEIDWGFFPILDENTTGNLIILDNEDYHLHIEYASSNDNDSSFQVYHPKESSFVCIEPLSSLNPREPTSLFSHIQLKISLY